MVTIESITAQSIGPNGSKLLPFSTGALSWKWRSRRGHFAFCLVPLEPERDTGLIPEVALIVVATCKAGAESGQHIIKLCGPNGNRFGEGNIDASADYEIKGVVAWRTREDAESSTSLNQIPVNVRVGSAKQRLYEWLKMVSAQFEGRAHVVGEQVG
jgi:hypothetical protein